MNAKTLLPYMCLVIAVISGVCFLSMAAKASAAKIRLEEEKGVGKMIGHTSNTEFIFFESITKFVTTTIDR